MIGFFRTARADARECSMSDVDGRPGLSARIGGTRMGLGQLLIMILEPGVADPGVRAIG
jgi:hypothetical protein